MKKNITTRVTNLNQLLNDEFNPEELQPDERVPCYTCDYTGSQRPPCTKIVSMHTFPKYWIITLKMFDNQHNKLQNTVRIPFSFMRNHRIYILLSAIIHEGDNSHEGHYFQIGRSVKDCNEAWKRKKRSIPLWFQYGNWFQSNDSRQMPMKLDRIKTLLNNNKKRRSWTYFRSPYLLIYKRFTNDRVLSIPIPSDMPNILSQPNDNNINTNGETFNDSNDDIPLLDLQKHNNTMNKNDTMACNHDVNVHENDNCNADKETKEDIDNEDNATTYDNDDDVELTSKEIWNCPTCDKLVVFVDHCMICGLLERDAKSLSDTITASLEKPGLPDINMNVDDNHDDNTSQQSPENEDICMEEASGLTQEFRDTMHVDQTSSFQMHFS